MGRLTVSESGTGSFHDWRVLDGYQTVARFHGPDGEQHAREWADAHQPKTEVTVARTARGTAEVDVRGLAVLGIYRHVGHPAWCTDELREEIAELVAERLRQAEAGQ